MARAQTNQMFIYAIAIILTGTLIFFGVSAISKVRQTSCDTGLTTFKDSIESLAQEAGAKRASGVGETIRTPCGVDKVLFFDRSKDVVFDGFDEFPAIQNTLNAETDKNTFLIKDGEVDDALRLDNLDINAPYFLCSNTDNGNIKLLVKSDFDGETTLWPMDELSDCTYEYTTSLKLSSEDLLFMMETLFEEDEDVIDESVVDPVAAGLEKSVAYEGGETRVTVSKENGTFDYYEYIPECAIKNFSHVTEAVGFSFDTAYTDSFPESRILQWSFSGGAESISYVFDSIVSPDCLRGHSPGLFGLALGDEPYPGVDPSRINRSQEIRKRQDLKPIENIDSEVFEHISSRYDKRMSGINEELDALYDEIRQSDLSQVDKSYLVQRLHRLRASLEENPGAVGAQVTYMINMINETNVNVTQRIDAKSLSQYGERKHALERRKNAEISQTEPACSISGSVCYDGLNITSECVDDTFIKRVTCQDNKCVYTENQACPGKCVDGECVPPSASNCYSKESTCIDANGKHYHDYCEDSYNLVEYECGGSLCNETRTNCYDMGATCVNGECIQDSVVECDTHKKNGSQICIETFSDGSTKELEQQCRMTTDEKVINVIGVGCNARKRCEYTSVSSQWADSCSCLSSGEVVCGSDRTCAKENGCKGKKPGSEYRCDGNYGKDKDGPYMCTCTSDCDVHSSCAIQNACDGKEYGDTFRCDSQKAEDPKGAYTCSCDPYCNVKKEGSYVCTTTNGCEARSPGDTYQCDKNKHHDPAGHFRCICDDNCRVESFCMKGNGCDERTPGATYPCDANMKYKQGGTFECICGDQCGITRLCDKGNGCDGKEAGATFRCDGGKKADHDGEYLCTCEHYCTITKESMDNASELECNGTYDIGDADSPQLFDYDGYDLSQISACGDNICNDYCIDSSRLREFYCDANEHIVDEYVNCTGECIGDVCVEATQLQCNGTYDPSDAGSAILTHYQGLDLVQISACGDNICNDYCTDPSTLREFSCNDDGHIIDAYVNCTGVCSNSACQEEGEEALHAEACNASRPCSGNLICKQMGDYPSQGSKCCNAEECAVTDGCMPESTYIFSSTPEKQKCINGEWYPCYSEGYDFYERGSVTGRPSSVYNDDVADDYCVESTKLREFYLDTNCYIKYEDVDCADECANGVCLESNESAVCNESNGCDGWNPGSEFPCDAEGDYNPGGGFNCVCSDDCSVLSSCAAGNDCDGLQPADTFNCDSQGNKKSSGNYVCTCGPSCQVIDRNDCTETDDGMDTAHNSTIEGFMRVDGNGFYDEDGTNIIWINRTKGDNCYPMNPNNGTYDLMENFCDNGFIKRERVTCPGNCTDGACQ